MAAMVAVEDFVSLPCYFWYVSGGAPGLSLLSQGPGDIEGDRSQGKIPVIQLRLKVEESRRPCLKDPFQGSGLGNGGKMGPEGWP